MQLPENTKMEFYGQDYIISGAGMTAELFQTIVATMTPDEQDRCIGWRALGRSRTQNQ